MSTIKYLIFQLLWMFVLTDPDDNKLYTCILPDWYYFTVTRSCIQAFIGGETMLDREDNMDGLCTSSFVPPEGMAVRPFNIKSDEMMDFIVKVVIQGSRSYHPYWTGLYVVEGVYLWSDGTFARYFKWAPNQGPSSEPHCVKLQFGQYYTWSCASAYFPICELYGTTLKNLFTCNRGFHQVGDVCEAKDKCSYKNGGCDHTCVRLEHGAKCACNKGYRLAKDGRTCLDIDECTHHNGGCEHRCNNTDGMHGCDCYSGYQLISDGRHCIDIDECLQGDTNGGCDHTCWNGPGGRKCTCQEGFRIVNFTKCYQIYKKREFSEVLVIVFACLSPLTLIIFACLPRLCEIRKSKKKGHDDSGASESTVSIAPQKQSGVTDENRFESVFEVKEEVQ